MQYKLEVKTPVKYCWR